MIYTLSIKYQKIIAFLFMYVFYMGMIIPAFGNNNNSNESYNYSNFSGSIIQNKKNEKFNSTDNNHPFGKSKKQKASYKFNAESNSLISNSTNIGGPSQPEMSAFKPVSADNLVNLFTGDFNYNIPLMDVGGYPINIFYDANVGMEQEASWVGLGWNINPGNVNRNMRGIPDDFNGEEKLKQTQMTRPNITTGASLAGDVEIVGIKDFLDIGLGIKFGASYNNYLGPAVDLGVKGGLTFKLLDKVVSEKKADTGTFSLKMKVGINANLGSRSGLTISPSVSLTAGLFTDDKKIQQGGSGTFGLSTSYNSRSGIKELQLSGQMSFSKKEIDKGKNGKSGSISEGIYSSSISFIKPTYTPSIRMPLTNKSFAARGQVGGAIFGVYGSGEVEGYRQKSEIAPEDQVQEKPMVGFLHLENAKTNVNAVMDFSRLNDAEVTPKTTIISAPQYAYDVFSIQGEGTGGSIRAYRTDIGYMRDNVTYSKDRDINVGADVGIPGHFGANVNVIKTPSRYGDWTAGNRIQKSLKLGFKGPTVNSENVYFKNPGETSVLNPNQYSNIGDLDLVRFKLSGSAFSPIINSKLERFPKYGAKSILDINTAPSNNLRDKRTQVVSFLSAFEASEIGLEKTIRSYKSSLKPIVNELDYDNIPRVDISGSVRKAHHISQINVTEASGSRYVYGIPVYNIKQKDFSFSVSNLESATEDDKVNYNPNNATLNSSLLGTNTSNRDGYLQITETPAYAHSFLLTGLLSPDYVDVKGDGITEDDLGNAVKFNYSKMVGNSIWRTPLGTSSNSPLMANFNAGKLSETKDDKGVVTWGSRESWYTHSIESKNMIALFTLEDRYDGKGSSDFNGNGDNASINPNDQSQKKLRKIDLYNKSDLKKNGIANAKPIKTVHFQYNYDLCANAPGNNGNNADGTNISKGKLTLEKIYFTYYGKDRAKKNQYVFDYGTGANSNPAYQFSATDRWGSYKPKSENPGSTPLKNAYYPYSIQNKAKADQFAGAWSLKKILLPSGGQIEVQYESDDYAFVQNKRAANMTKILGFSSTNSNFTNKLYQVNGGGIIENNFVSIQVPVGCSSRDEVKSRYLDGQDQISFKLAVTMPKVIDEFITVYANVKDFGVGSTPNTIWLELATINDYSPLSLTAIEFLREQLPGQAFEGYDLSDGGGFDDAVEVLINKLGDLRSETEDVLLSLRGQGKAQSVNLSSSFVRLNNADGYKFGGGQRVKYVTIKDNWKKMNKDQLGNDQLYTSVYGQEYNYETTEIFNGVERKISSGVASYEPSLGGEENPFHTILQIENTVPMGPSSYSAVELPVLEGFFQGASVGYSKVTVKSIRNGLQNPTQKYRSGIGKQVSEYYTAKDYPTITGNTTFDLDSDKPFSKKSFGGIFYKYKIDKRTLSQGFIIQLNDMHGKMKSQASFPENDDKTAINYTETFYRNTGKKGLDDKLSFVFANEGGVIRDGNMGIDVELMNDVREFKTFATSREYQGQLDLFPIFAPIWIPFFWTPMSDNENVYRAVTTTKVINYHSIVDSVIVIDKGSQVTTKNLIYDSETGEVVVSRTNNEFNKPMYNTSYPAYWAYSGMGLAYKNIDAAFTNVNFYDGKIVSGNVPSDIIESGDELYVTKQENVITPTPVPPLTANITYICSGNGSSQGGTKLQFSFSSPTTAPIQLIFGSITGHLSFSGYNDFIVPTGIISSYPLSWIVNIPSGVTSYTVNDIYVDPATSYYPWVCFDLSSAPSYYTTDIYMKIAPSYTGPIPIFSLTNSNIVFHNSSPYTPPIPSCISSSSPDVLKLWAFDKTKNTTSLTVPNKDLVFMDADGKLFTKNNVSFRIVRSGHRNMLGTPVGSAVTLTPPFIDDKFIITSDTKTISASALEYKEKWKQDNDIFKRFRLETPPPNPTGPNLIVNGGFEQGYLSVSSDYRVVPYFPYFNDGFQYIVTSNLNPPFSHSGAYGMVVDGNDCGPCNPNDKVWKSQNIAVTPNTDYDFSAWFALRSIQNIPILEVRINNTVVAVWSPGVNWQDFHITWNSNASTVANITIRDATIVIAGNEFVMDDISFSTLSVQSCTPKIEVADCYGTLLEKNINPYTKGLLGTFRTDRSLVFYGERNENIPTTPTTINKDGTLKDFAMYWDLDNATSNLIPIVNSKWVWNSQITKVNAKGLELETKNALGIYTAAQYGYNKTMQVAMANNSKYEEMFAEGFEDKDYNESINTGVTFNNCAKAKHIDFTGMLYSGIIPATNFNAHTGKNVLALLGNNKATKSILITDYNIVNPELNLEQSSVGSLIDPGITATGSFAMQSNTNFSNHYDIDGAGATVFNPDGTVTYDNFPHPFSTTSIGYFPVTNTGSFNFLVQKINEISASYIINAPPFNGSPYPLPVQFIPTHCVFKIYNEDNVLLNLYDFPTISNSQLDNGIQIPTLRLCPANYKIQLILEGTYILIPAFTPVQLFQASARSNFDIVIKNAGSIIPSFRDKAISCTATKPIKGKENMLNQTFTIPANKPMQFSAWIREGCTNLTTPTSCGNGYIQLIFRDASGNIVNLPDGSSAVNCLPTGAIIEGWQRIDNKFLPPLGATSAQINFVNDGAQPIYFDDVRMHPYNANMTSYVYDPINLRLTAQMDANNYASYYEYDEEGTLIRTKVETKEGVKTITETRSAKQKNIDTVQQ